MVSGPVIAAILEKEHAVYEFRKLIGVTDSQKAAPGTIRKEFGTNTTMNAVHGSDSDINANREIRFFFSELEEMK
jgi:nucleoside-diphosphate kinase